MKVDNIIDVIKNIYEHLMDEESRYIFEERLLFSITGNLDHIRNVIKTIKEGEWLCNVIDTEDELYIWGAGIWGKAILRVWPDSWKAVLDNNSAKWGDMIGNIPILNPNNVLNGKFNGKVFISSRLYHNEIYEQLISYGLSDENIVNVGAILDRQVEKQYFSLAQLPHDTKEIFVDAGSWNGMTAINFIKWSKNKFKKVYCFEPDAKNIQQCEKTLHYYINKGQAEVIKKAVWSSSGEMKFISRGNGASEIFEKYNDTTENTIDVINVISLDELFRNEKVSFIKMDIEGSEFEALVGCKKIIQKYKPKLAICIYHKLDDILTLPELILRYNPNYKLYIRHYSIAAEETVLYAI